MPPPEEHEPLPTDSNPDMPLVAMALFGAGFVLFALFDGATSLYWELLMKKTVAQVVFFQDSPKTTRHGGRISLPVLEFQSHTGMPYQIPHERSFWEPRYALGTTLPIAYDPEAPADLRVATFEGLWLRSSLALGGGLFALAFFRWRTRRQLA